MKKLVIAFLLILFLMCSCGIRQNLFYYGYFGDSSFVVVYNAEKNILYKVDIPLETLVAWGTKHGYNNMKEIMQDFAGVRENGFMAGTSDARKTLNAVINSIAGQEVSSEEQKLKIIVKQTDLMKDEEFMSQISSLCSTDLSILAGTIISSKPDTCYINAGTFLTNDADTAQKYFAQWIGQII